MATHTEDDRSLGELFSEMTREVSQLFREEVELAKTETKEELRKGAAAGAMFGAAGFLGYLATMLLSFAAAWALAEVLPTELGFLIVGLVFAVGAAVCFVLGRRKIQQFNPVPQQTVETLKEDLEWARARKT